MYWNVEFMGVEDESKTKLINKAIQKLWKETKYQHNTFQMTAFTSNQIILQRIYMERILLPSIYPAIYTMCRDPFWVART